MKSGIHPDYKEATVHCSCGAEFETRSTQEAIRIELCSECHPFYSGVQKIVDTGGRVQRFQDRYGDKYKNKVAQKETKATSAKEEASTKASSDE